MANDTSVQIGPRPSRRPSAGGVGRRPSRIAPRPRAPSPPPYVPGVFELDEVRPGPSLPASNVASARASVVDLEVGSSDGSDSETRAVKAPSIQERELPALPPVDGGRGAWSFLIAATLIETIVWGLPWSVGVLHQYWASTMFVGNESTLTLAATLQTGFMYMTAAVLGPIFAAFPRTDRATQILGLVVATAALIASAFVTQAWQLVITIGILYPFAGALYLPCATLLYEWFQLRRGIATGIMFAGTGVGGTVFPFIVSALLSRFGYKATMISLGIGFGILNAVALVFIKRRIPIGRVSSSRDHSGNKSVFRTIDWSFLRRRGFWTATAVILATAMGNFIPSLWIPSYAETVRATKPNGTALVAIMNAASVPGNTLTGYLSDRFHPRVVIPLSCTLATISTLVLWGFGTTDALLVCFSILWGFTALSFVGLWSKMITIIGSEYLWRWLFRKKIVAGGTKAVAGGAGRRFGGWAPQTQKSYLSLTPGNVLDFLAKDDPTLPGLFFSFFTILKGIGNLTSGPVATALLKSGSMKGAAGAYGSTNYGLLLIYTGSVTALGGIVGVTFPDK